MRYIVDIDQTICYTENSDYPNSRPITKNIARVNSLYDEGHVIIYWTARGGNSGKDWGEFTKRQLTLWGCRYTELWMNKPSYDVWVDDKAEWIFNESE